MIISNLSYVETVEETSTSNINGGVSIVTIADALQIAGANSVALSFSGNAIASSVAKNKLEYRR
ncbi:MAG: hypothetical protein ACRC2R_13000 [Xenococcaceae cyanobacterium]